MAFSIVCDCCGEKIPENETFYETTAKRWVFGGLEHEMKVFRSFDCEKNANYCAACYEAPRPRRAVG